MDKYSFRKRNEAGLGALILVPPGHLPDETYKKRSGKRHFGVRQQDSNLCASSVPIQKSELYPLVHKGLVSSIPLKEFRINHIQDRGIEFETSISYLCLHTISILNSLSSLYEKTRKRFQNSYY